MKKKLYALIVSALAVVMTAPAFALTAFAAPEDNTDEVEAADAAEEETQETEPPVPQDTKPFDAEEFLESYTTAKEDISINVSNCYTGFHQPKMSIIPNVVPM